MDLAGLWHPRSTSLADDLILKLRSVALMDRSISLAIQFALHATSFDHKRVAFRDLRPTEIKIFC